MSSQLSKRQQARNERVLQDLIKTVPGNNVCADCQARNPGWASWSLGIFLCMQCAAVHRKLGTHITKVKSLTMDSWSHEQVETMKRVGNLASNRIYNPKNTQAPINYDANETDAAMERFIRQKYQGEVIEVSKISDSPKFEPGTDDHPPPLPPKTGPRLGLRSTSSILPLSFHHKRETMRQNETDNRPNLRRNKPSRVFGITVQVADDYESKNLKLCNMGFTDQSKNMAVLKELGGNLEKSIEALVCSGEKNVMGSKQNANFPESRSTSTSALSDRCNFSSNSSSINIKSSINSSNPFSAYESVAQPQSSQSTGVLQFQTMDSLNQQHIESNFNNLMPSQSSTILNQEFQRMPFDKSQSLFPNRTGPGFPGAQVSQVELQQKSLTPPVPYLSKQYHGATIFQDSTQQVNQNANYNPFSQSLSQALPIGQTKTSDFSNHYHLKNFHSHQNPIQSSTYHTPLSNLDYSVQQPQEGSNPYQKKTESVDTILASFTTQGLPQKFNELTLNNQFQATQAKASLVMPQPSCKFDSRSILDLYNYPHLAPDRPVLEKNIIHNHTTYLSEKKDTHFSLSSTNSNSNNPFVCDLSFATSLGQDETAPIQMISRNLSEESLSADGGWMNGRHSPDAWKSISARSMR
ncbi:putative uba ts-n domain-containing protein [Erysiphe neolycopersici]|uniref:Putative uba ts-n domain-containing protein n=1 Tax=Erysiphe neolycopersici TaxID=212602 RepID=A0A420HIT8_9PEZI|nr:putative uba ts-n domain-containing protein [Erysiphe neolycopersici]